MNGVKSIIGFILISGKRVDFPGGKVHWMSKFSDSHKYLWEAQRELGETPNQEEDRLIPWTEIKEQREVPVYVVEKDGELYEFEESVIACVIRDKALFEEEVKELEELRKQANGNTDEKEEIITL